MSASANSLSLRAWVRERAHIGLFVVISACLNAGLPPLIQGLETSGFDEEILWLAGLAGVICGECLVVVLLSGLSCRTWLGGFLLGLAISSVGFCALLLGVWFSDGDSLEALPAIGMLPSFLFAATAPLYLFRQMFHWRLVRGRQKVLPSPPIGIADLFSFVAIAAATLVLLRAPAVIWETDQSDFWPPVLIVCGVLFAMGWLVAPLAAWLAFGVRSRLKSWCGLILLGLAVFMAIVIISQFFYSWSASWNERREPIPVIATLVGGAWSVLSFIVIVFSLNGMSLVRRQGGEPVRNAVAERTEDVMLEVARQRRRTRWRIAIAIAVTTIVSVALAWLQSWRSARDQENKRLQAIAERLDGQLGIYDRQVMTIQLGNAADGDIDQFKECSRVTNLELRSPHFTDGALARIRYFPLVGYLALSGTNITDDGLVHLANLRQLTSLELGHTQVTGSGLRYFVDGSPLASLNVDYSRFDDSSCSLLPWFTSLKSISLKRTLITDDGLRHLVKLPSLQWLDLRGTTTCGVGIRGYRSLYTLQLDNTIVDDAGVAGLKDSHQLHSFSLSSTPITDGVFEYIRNFDHLGFLNVSHTSVTDAGVERISHLTQLESLDASETSITGVGFRAWDSQSRLSTLNLAGTAIDDEGVRYLRNIPKLETLSLARTEVTDACLPQLALLPLSDLDLRQTNVTAGGILAHSWPWLKRLRLVVGQFTEAELSQLKQRLSVEITVTDNVDEQGDDEDE